MVEPSPSVVEHNKGKPLANAEKRCVLHVFTNVSEDNPHITLDEVAGLVANPTGTSKASVYRARKEVKSDKTRKAKQLSEKRQLYGIRHS
jgi:hypothetical protein